MAEMLQRADANSGSFYYFFRSKEDLLLAVLDRYQEILYPVLLEPIWKTTRNPIDRIFRLLTKYRELILASNFAYGCPIGRLAMELDAGQKAIHRKIAVNFDAWKAAIEQCVKEAQEQQELPRGVDAERLACLVLSVMEGGVMQARSYGDARPFDLSVKELRQYFATLRSQAPRGKAARSKKNKTRRSEWEGLPRRSQS